MYICYLWIMIASPNEIAANLQLILEMKAQWIGGGGTQHGTQPSERVPMKRPNRERRLDWHAHAAESMVAQEELTSSFLIAATQRPFLEVLFFLGCIVRCSLSRCTTRRRCARQYRSGAHFCQQKPDGGDVDLGCGYQCTLCDGQYVMYVHVYIYTCVCMYT